MGSVRSRRISLSGFILWRSRTRICAAVVASFSDAPGFDFWRAWVPSSPRNQHPRPRRRYEHAAPASACIRARSAPQRRRSAGHDFSARWVRFARAQWVRFARAQWVRFAVNGSLFLDSCYGDLELGFAQRLWPHFLTRLGSISGAIGFPSSARNNTLDCAADTSTQRKQVRAFVPGPPLNAGAQPVTKRTQTAGQVLRPVRHRIYGLIDWGNRRGALRES